MAMAEGKSAATPLNSLNPNKAQLTLLHMGSGTYIITWGCPPPEKCLFMQEIILFRAKFIFYIILAFFWGI